MANAIRQRRIADVVADDGKSGKSLYREGFQEVVRRLRYGEDGGISVSRREGAHRP